MKKVLLATTALIAASVAAGQANAQAVQTKAPFTLKLDGFVSEYAGIPAEKRTNGSTSQATAQFKTDLRLIFDAGATADNGLNYGVFLRLNTTPRRTASGAVGDRANVYFAGWFGRIEAGVQKSAPYKFFWQNIVPNDTAQPYGDGTGLANGTNGPLATSFLSDANVGNAIANLSQLGAGTSDSNNAAKITWVSPKFMGFTGGFSFAPDGQNRGNDGNAGSDAYRSGTVAYATGLNITRVSGTGSSQDLSNYQNIFEVGLKYDRKADLGFGEVSYLGVLGYTHGDAKSLSGNAASGATGFSDMNSLYGGMRFDWAGLSLGGGLTFNGKSGQINYSLNGTQKTQFHSDASGYAIGGQYKIGPWATSLYWQQAFSEGSVVRVGGNKLEAEELAVTYLLAPGLQLITDVYHYNIRDDGGDFLSGGGATTGARDGWVFIAGPAITF